MNLSQSVKGHLQIILNKNKTTLAALTKETLLPAKFQNVSTKEDQTWATNSSRIWNKEQENPEKKIKKDRKREFWNIRLLIRKSTKDYLMNKRTKWWWMLLDLVYSFHNSHWSYKIHRCLAHLRIHRRSRHNRHLRVE